MSWTFSEDVDAYADAVGPLLSRWPAEHTIALTVIEYARRQPGPGDPPELYGWWTDDSGAVTGAMLHTPGYEPLLERVPDEAVRPLLDALVERGHGVTGVNGPAQEALTFAAVASSTLGCRAELGHAMRLFRLDDLQVPDPLPPGAARSAGHADEPWLAEWVQAFATEAHSPVADPVGEVVKRLGHDGFRVWVDGEGEPVSMAARGLPAAGVSRIGPVYTPPRQRRHGYGAAVTAAAAASILQEGALPVLFTDLANPTSNALYQRLGFRSVSNRVWLTFHDPEAG